MCFNEHDQEDGVPAGPAQEVTPDHKGMEPAAFLVKKECVWSNPSADIDELQVMYKTSKVCLLADLLSTLCDTDIADAATRHED